MGLDNNSLNATAGIYIYIYILSIEPAGLALNILIGLPCGVSNLCSQKELFIGINYFSSNQRVKTAAAITRSRELS